MTENQEEAVSKIRVSDLSALDHAVLTLSKSLSTILSTCPELADIDLEHPSQSDRADEVLSLMKKPRLSVARALKIAYNNGQFPLADQVAAAVQTQQTATIPKFGASSLGTFPVSPSGVASTDPVILGSFTTHKRTSSDSDLSDTSVNDSEPSTGRNTRRKKWPPPVPSITDKELLRQVFTHKSVANEKYYLDKTELLNIHNERLEFLGDAVLNYTIGGIVFKHFPDASEGELTSIRSFLVCNDTLAKWATTYELDKKLQTNFEVTRGNDDGGRTSKIIADVFEAYVGGLVLASKDGTHLVGQWLSDLVEPYILSLKQERRETEPVNKDAKNMLYAQIGTGVGGPEYVTTVEGNHASPFTVECRFKGQCIGRGTGVNTKVAGLRAAMSAFNNKELIDQLVEERRKIFQVFPSGDKLSALETGSSTGVSNSDSDQVMDTSPSSDHKKSTTAATTQNKKQTGPKDVLYSLIGSADNRPMYKTESSKVGFHTKVSIRSEYIGEGYGRTKKDSENAAAEDALNNHNDLVSKWSQHRNVFHSH